MPPSLALITRFFQLVSQKQFAEAERVFERLREKMQDDEWNRGYFQALKGILLVQKSSEGRYSNIDISNKEAIKKNRREFIKNTKSRFHADYDRGFFSAWASFMRVVLTLYKEGSTEISK